MNYPYSEIGNRIWELRKERNLTREKLSEMADISVQFLADIEKGRKSMTIATLQRLSEALMTTTDYIVFGRDNLSETIDSELLGLCLSLSMSNQKRAAKIIRAFIDAMNDNEN